MGAFALGAVLITAVLSPSQPYLLFKVESLNLTQLDSFWKTWPRIQTGAVSSCGEVDMKELFISLESSLHLTYRSMGNIFPSICLRTFPRYLETL